MAKQSENTRFIKMAKILQKAIHEHVLLNARLMKLGQIHSLATTFSLSYWRSKVQNGKNMSKKATFHVLLNSTLTKLGPKVDQHLPRFQNEDQFWFVEVALVLSWPGVGNGQNSPKVAKMAKQNENARVRQNGQKISQNYKNTSKKQTYVFYWIPRQWNLARKLINIFLQNEDQKVI